MSLPPYKLTRCALRWRRLFTRTLLPLSVLPESKIPRLVRELALVIILLSPYL